MYHRLSESAKVFQPRHQALTLLEHEVRKQVQEYLLQVSDTLHRTPDLSTKVSGMESPGRMNKHLLGTSL